MAETIPSMENNSSELNGSDIFNAVQLDNLHLFGEYPKPLLDFAAACCAIFMLIGIPGNLITILALARYKKIRNATAIFIINLSCSDLLFCCINLPLAATTFATRTWPLGDFMCRFFPFARFALAGVSLFTVLAITANRYIMISHPRLYVKFFTSRNLGIIIAFTWILGVSILIPIWTETWGRFGMDVKDGFCVVISDSTGKSPMKFIFACAFIVPFLMLSICYIRIFYLVRKTTLKSRGTIRKRRFPIEKEDSSLATSSPDSEATTNHHKTLALEHPRIQSLRPPPTPTVKVTIVDERLSSSNSNSILNIGRSFHLRKSQILDRAAPTTKDKRLLAMITTIMITFFVCHLPITVIKVFHNTDTPSPAAIIVTYLLRYLTTCVNPVIYVVMSYEYRKAYKKVLVLPCGRGKT